MEERMVIGVPREIKPDENRVALLPASAGTLVRHGHRVLVEEGAGVGSGAQDAEYKAAGAEVVAGAARVFGEADLLVKVKETLREE
jgi:alanine dehydrogenase